MSFYINFLHGGFEHLPYTYAYVHTYMHARVHACIHTYLPTYVHVLSIDIYVYTCIYACIHTYMHRVNPCCSNRVQYHTREKHDNIRPDLKLVCGRKLCSYWCFFCAGDWQFVVKTCAPYGAFFVLVICSLWSKVLLE